MRDEEERGWKRLHERGEELSRTMEQCASRRRMRSVGPRRDSNARRTNSVAPSRFCWDQPGTEPDRTNWEQEQNPSIVNEDDDGGGERE